MIAGWQMEHTHYGAAPQMRAGGRHHRSNLITPRINEVVIYSMGSTCCHGGGCNTVPPGGEGRGTVAVH